MRSVLRDSLYLFRSATLISLIALVFGAALAVGAGCTKQEEATTHEAPVAVDVMEVRAMDLPLAIDLVGSVQPVRRVRVGAEVPGRVVKVLVDMGDKVVRMDRLALLDRTNFELALQEAEGNLAMAMAGLSKATLTLERVERLHEKNAIAQNRYDEAQIGYDVAQAQLERAKAAVGIAKERLSKTTVISPFNGWVSHRLAEVGAQVAPGIPLFVIIDLSKVKITVAVTDKDYALIDADDPVEITVDALPGENFAGAINKIGVDADPKTGTFSIEITAPNSGARLKGGMMAHVKIVREVVQGAIVIPQSAVLIRGDERIAFIVGPDDRAARRPLTLGSTLSDDVIITSGLKVGDRLIVRGQHYLQEGSKLSILSSGGPGVPSNHAESDQMKDSTTR